MAAMSKPNPAAKISKPNTIPRTISLKSRLGECARGCGKRLSRQRGVASGKDVPKSFPEQY